MISCGRQLLNAFGTGAEIPQLDLPLSAFALKRGVMLRRFAAFELLSGRIPQDGRYVCRSEMYIVLEKHDDAS
jgi:hypothetical protein